jgi:c-di-GMP phosphodiesterase
MSFNAPLGSVALQHTAMIDAHSSLLAVHLGWQALPGQPRVPLQALLPAMAETVLTLPSAVMLPAYSTADLAALLSLEAPEGLWVEFPAALCAQPGVDATLRTLHERGAKLVSRERLPPDHALFSLVCMAIDEAKPVGPQRLAEGVHTLDAYEAALAKSACATLGWPVQGPPAKAVVTKAEGMLSTIVQVIQAIDQGQEVEVVSNLLDRSPTLTFKLLQYLNSPACGLRHELSSIRHAIMMLGYRRLRTWVALLLANAVETPRTRALTQAAIRRAFFLQELARRMGDQDDRGDLFVCGMFSLLDRAIGQPMKTLLTGMPLAPEIYQCLAEDTGPLKPFLDLARQVEGSLALELTPACEAAALMPEEVNLAVLGALHKAALLQA